MYALNKNVTYFDSFGVEHIPKDIKLIINKSVVAANIFTKQEYDSIMCGYFCIRFIDFMLSDKTLTEYTNLFAPSNFKNNNGIVLKYFMTNVYKMAQCNSHETLNIYIYIYIYIYPNLHDQ